MLQQYTYTDEEARVEDYTHEGVRVIVNCFAGHCHAEATTMFLSDRRSKTFHADKYCSSLHQARTHESSDGPYRVITALPLECAVCDWEMEPCSHCTGDVEQSARVAHERGGVPYSLMKLKGETPTTIEEKAKSLLGGEKA